MERSSVLVRLGASLLALGAGAAGIVVVVVLLRSVPGPVSSAPPLTSAAATTTQPTVPGGRIATPTEPAFPSPPENAIVTAREAGTRALGVALVRGSKTSLVRVSVLSGDGPGLSGLDVSVRFGTSAQVVLSACGAGCYQAHIPTSSVMSKLAVTLGRTSYPLTLPTSRTLPDGTAIVNRAAAAWKKLTTVVWHERLAASPTDALHTLYRAVAPDELSYTIAGASASIIIGNRRWDRGTPTGRWLESPQQPALHQPLPIWVTPTDARVLASTTVAGQSAWVVSFFDPGTPAWFVASISKRTYRTLELTMTAPAHFMHHVYGPFNAPFKLHPPT